MKPKLNHKIALEWFEAFNQHDLEKLLKLYHDNARYFSPKLKIHKPETTGFIQGKEELRAWWKNAFKRLPNLVYEPTNFIADKSQIFMEYIRKVDGEEQMMVEEVLEIVNGLILSSRVYHS
jgi:hypothetical protein